MSCSSISTSIGAARSAVVIACALVLAAAAPAAAQTYCATLADTLLDTSDNCVSEPWRDRAMTGVETFEWEGHDYLIFNRGNELTIYEIDNPSNPDHVDTSNNDFGTRGDSDYDLVAFDVCDDCRYGVLSHKVERTVIFDLGSGGIPDFGATASYAAADTDLGGHVFSKGGQQYLLAKMSGEPCTGSGLYTLDGVSNFTLLECVEVGGSGLLVRGLQTVTDGGTTYLYAAGIDGAVHIFRADGSGADLSLTYLRSPAGMKGKAYALSIDSENLRAASTNYSSQLITIWDLDAPNPGDPNDLYDIPLKASSVSLRAPSSGSLSTLLTMSAGGWDTLRAFTVGATGYEPVVDESYWTDGTLPHNNFPGCVFLVDGALSPDGSVAYVSKFGVHQVFDLTECLEPTPAWANLSISPSTVFPGQSVEVRDTSSGRIDEWALWITEDGNLVAGNDNLNTWNLRTLDYTIPQDVAANVDYVAHIEVDSSELTPDRGSYDKTINIDRTPQASFTITPSAVIVGDSVTLTASAEGIVGSGGYDWFITDPGNVTVSRTGKTTTVVMDDSGNWDFELRVNYDHQDPADPPNLYQATAEILNFEVSSVAADFFWSPTNPLHTQAITLNASTSKPSSGLTFQWQVTSPTHTYAGCASAGVQCTIPADTLNPDTSYTITLTASNGDDVSVKTKYMFVGNGEIQPEITFSPSSPEIGQDIVFTIGGVPADVDSANWDMDGSGCDGADSTPTCTPNLYDNCKAQAYRYSSSGAKDVEVTLEIGGNTFYASTTVTVASTGSCDGGGDPPPDPGGDPCDYDLYPSTAEMGPKERVVDFTVLTSSGCTWTASTTTPWITVLSPTGQRTGPGTVTYRVAENTGPERTGHITAGGRAYLVIQQAPWAAANFTMSKSEPNIGDVVTFTADPVLEIASWDFGEDNCDGTDSFINCGYFVAGTCNTFQWSYPTDGVKTVTLVLTDGRVKPKTLTVHPEGECCYADGRPDADFEMSTDELYAGQTLYLTDLSSKALTAKALSFSWTPPDPDIGEAVVFTMEGTTGTIAKATWDFGEPGCGGLPAVRECQPALFNDCTAIDFTFASSGDKTVSVEVEYEGGSTDSVGPYTVTVTNAGSCDGGGVSCSYSLSSTSESFPSTGGSGSFDVTTGAECDWSATTTSSWLSFSPTGGTGPATVEYTVEPNLGTSTRSGTIKVEGKTFRVSQEADTGDTAPTDWRWTITRVENEEGESVDQDVFTSSSPNPSFRFSLPGRYRVTLVAINCYGSRTASDYVDVLEAPVEEFVIGSAISKGGANDTKWESDFRFYNPCDESLDVNLVFQPENQDNTGKQLSSYPFSLGPNETMVFASAREIVSGEDGDPINGSIRIDSSSDSGCKVMSVSRTFNDTPGGSLGLFVPTMPVTPAGRATLNFTGLIQNDAYRSNLRLVNHGDELAWVRITAFDKDGLVLGEPKTLKVYGRSTKQIDNVAGTVGVTEELDQFTVQAEVRTEGAVIDGIATVIDNLSGDSVMNRPSHLDEPVAWLPGVTHASGVNDTLWQTDIWIHNPNPDDPWLTSRATYVDGGDVSLNYLFEAPDWPTLESMAMRKRLGVAGSILADLGVERTSGYLILEGLDGDSPPQVAARTFTSGESGGTFGLHLPVFGSRDLLEVGKVGYIVGVSNSADDGFGFRTNLGMLATGRTAEVEITFFYPDGSQAPEPWVTTVWAGQLKQINNVFRKFGLGDQTVTGTFRIEVLSGGGLAVYMTEIDNQSGDSIFVPAQQIIMGLAP